MPVPGSQFAMPRRRRRRGLLTSVPAPLSIAALVVGAFLVGRDPGIAAVLVAVASIGFGAATLRARQMQAARELRALEQAAYSDPLTGLANRRLLVSMLNHEIRRHLRHDGRFVVLMLDLDGFKQINDVHGHEAGDLMLCNVADALTHNLRAQDTVARLGGDEFCVIAPETEDPRTLAQRVNRAVSSAGAEHDRLAGSVGVALFPDDGTSSDKLLRMADDRLVAAKRRLHSGRRRSEETGRRVRTAA